MAAGEKEGIIWGAGGGNPNLNPEGALQYELGLEKDFGLGLAWTSYFYNNVEGLIQKIDKQYVNVGRTVLKGVETGSQMRLLSWMHLRCDYTYLSARDKELNQDLSRRPRHKINLELGFRFHHNTFLDLLTSYTAHQFEYLKARNVRRLDDFLLINLNLRKEFFLYSSMKGEFFASISNLTDLDYDDGHGPMPGRNFLVGIKIIR